METAVVQKTKVAENVLDVARHLSESYKRTEGARANFVREGIRFGAELSQWANFLGEARGCESEGEGLKAWLEQFCPEINYKTAMSYKRMAALALNQLGGGEYARAALVGESQVTLPSGEVKEVPARYREKAELFYSEATSRRKLERLCLGETGAKRGRPKGSTYSEMRLTPVENAVRVVAPLILPIMKHRGAWAKALPLLPDEKLEEAKATLAEFLGAIEREIANR